MENPNEERLRAEEKASILADYDRMSIGWTDDAILLAISHPDWRELLQAFDSRTAAGFDPNWDCHYQGTILTLALQTPGQYDVAEYLLSIGADPNIPSIVKTSPLEIAAEVRDDGAPILTQLLRYGAKTENDRALHLAAAAGCLAKTKVLLGAKMDVGVLTSGPRRGSGLAKGMPLHEAAAAHFDPREEGDERDGIGRWDPEEQVEVIEALLAAGADPEARDDGGRKPAVWAGGRPGYQGGRFKLRDQGHVEEGFDKKRHIERVRALLEKSKESMAEL